MLDESGNVLDARGDATLALWLLLAALLLGPATARADSAVVPTIAIGAEVSTDERYRFRLGVGADWLHDFGLTLAARLDARHSLSATASLLAGWSGPGIREGRGVALGAMLGPSAGVDVDGRFRAGGRAVVSWGLWFKRAAIELDATVYRALDPARSAGVDVAVGLALTVAPWVPIPF